MHAGIQARWLTVSSSRRVAGLALASLAIRLYRQNCWIFRYDSRLRLIKPHGAVSWTIFSLFSIACESLQIRHSL